MDINASPSPQPSPPAGLKIPRQYRVSGYTATPHGYASEIVDAGAWQSYRSGVGPKPLKEITDWVLCEPVF